MKTDNAFYCVNAPRVVHETVEGESILVDLHTGNYFSLEKSGAYLWELLAVKGLSEAEITAAFRDRYEGDPAKMEKAVRVCIRQMLEEELIRPAAKKEAPTPPGPAPLEKGAAKTLFEEPRLQKFSDMKEFLLIDPIHEVNIKGWPHRPEE